MKRRERMEAGTLAAPLLLGAMCFGLLPLLMVAYYSLTDGTGFAGAEHYISVLRSSAFRLAVGNTCRFLAIGITCGVLVSFAVALLIHSAVPGGKLIRVLMLLPMTVGTSGIVLTARRLLGDAPALEGAGTFWVLEAIYIWKNCGLFALIFLVGLNAIPKEYYDFADVEGANRRQKLMYITLPMMGPSFWFVVILGAIQAIKVSREAFVLFGNHPNESAYMIQHYLYNNFLNMDLRRLSAASILTVAAAALFSAFLGRLRRDDGEVAL